MARRLSNIDGDEVALVKRGANRRRFLLKKSDEGALMDPELADILSVPAPGEGALLDEVRKDGGDETTAEAVAMALRVIHGVNADLSRETIAKLGTALYPQVNDDLNSGKGAAGKPTQVSSGRSRVQGDDGEFTDDGASDDANWDEDYDTDQMAVGKKKDEPEDEDDVEKRQFSTAERESAASSGDAEPDGSYPIESKLDLKNAIKDFGRSKNKGKTKAHIVARAKALGATGMLPKGWSVSKSDDTEGGAPVDSPTSVPIKKEDGTWDLSGVPADARPFYEEQIQKAAEAVSELSAARERIEKAESETKAIQETLKQREFIAKADAEFPVVGPRDEVALILKSASESFDEETYGKLETILKAANERIATGNLFAELGRASRGEDGKQSSAEQEAIAKADELVAKSTDGLSKDAALGLVWEQNPALYDRYLAEKPSLWASGPMDAATMAAYQQSTGGGN